MGGKKYLSSNTSKCYTRNDSVIFASEQQQESCWLRKGNEKALKQEKFIQRLALARQLLQ